MNTGTSGFVLAVWDAEALFRVPPAQMRLLAPPPVNARSPRGYFFSKGGRLYTRGLYKQGFI